MMTARKTAVLCAAMTALGPISLALYTPAMPTLVAYFDTSQAAGKLTMTSYLAGFAFLQLVCGPLSDAFGRRPVLIGFICLYIVASLAAVLAPSIDLLILARFFQGAGAAVGIALSRAIVRDLYVGQASARIMNVIALIMGLAPALSPSIGGLTLEFLSWRDIFLLMLIYGAVTLFVMIRFLPETNVRRDRERARPPTLLRNYRIVGSDRRFLRAALILGLTLGSFFTLATMLPFVLMDRVGLRPSHFGMAMLVQSAAFVLGSTLTNFLLRRVDAQRLMLPGITLVVGCAILLFSGLVLLGPSLVTVVGPLALFGCAIALIMPAAQTAAVAPFPTMAGTASALLGFLQIGTGLLGSLTATFFSDPVLGLTLIVPAMHLGAALAFVLLAPRPPQPGVAVSAGQPAE